jgi:GNAT superfamily N-acetyltransferase
LTAAVTVRPVRTRADLRRFVAFPYRLHREDPLWVPPLRRDVYTMLSREKNPFFRRAAAEYFLAQRNGQVLGRIAAIHNRAHNDFHEDRVGFFGFLETVDDQQVASALFDAAAAWLRSRSLETMRGPTSFSTNDECGLLVDGFDTPPTVMNPHNPSYYGTLVEGAGFAKARDLYQYQTPSDRLPERLERAAQKVQQRLRLQLRPIDMKRFKEEVDGIKPLYNGAWEKNWGFVPMTDAEIDHLAKQLKPVVVPDLVVFAERDGVPIGFAVAIPDFNVALKANPSGRLFPGILKILWRSRSIRRIRILLLGVAKEYRGLGAAELMYHWIWTKGTALGYNWGEAGWILEDNLPMRKGVEFMGFEPYKTLRMYDRPL